MKRYNYFIMLCICALAFFNTNDAYAKGEVTFYAKVKAQVSSSSTNMGKVYAGTSNSAGTYDAPSSTSGDLNSGQKESGTTSADVGPFYAFAQENNNYVFEGWKETDDANADWYSRDKTCQITVTSTAQSSGGYTKTLYAFFSVKKKVTVTMPATENGRYTYSCTDGNGTVNTTTSQTIITDAEITFTATPISGYKFFGWYTLDGSTETFLNYSDTYKTTFTTNTTLYAKFIPTTTAVFTLKGTAQYFYDLNTANSAAVASSNKIIVPTANGTIPAGNYTISGGVTLLIPFDDANTLYTTEPTWPKQAPSGQSAYRKLTLKSGVNIVVNGAISVSAQSQGNQPYGGCVYGKYGQIDMESGATITINNGANLYCWGYITGGGAITAKSGAKVYEDFQLTCWRGGTAASTMNNNASSKGVFPLAQYYIQNIEAPLTLEAGALEYTCTAVTAMSSVWDATVQIVGTNSGLFHISSGSITKWYDAAKDRQMYSINGNTKLGAVVVDVSVKISSEKFVLPITNNMDITIASGTLTCDQRVALLPGARIVIDEGATVKFDSGSKFFIYDKDEWKGSYNGSMVSYNYPGNATHLPAPYSPTCSSIKTLRTFDKMDDAELDVNGTLEMTGALYTTIHGANVRSSNGTGIIKYKTSAGTESVTYQAFQGGNGGTEITWQNISITSAKLHNSTTVTSAYGADFEYLATAGTAANTTITYADGHWGWMEIWTDENNNVLYASNTAAKVNNASAKTCPTKTGYNGSWTTTTTDDLQKVLHKASYTPVEYSITYNNLEGASNSNPANYTIESANITLVNPGNRAGYDFGGWFTNEGLTTPAATPAIAHGSTGNKTFYAKWTLKTYAITYDKGANGTGTIDAGVKTHGVTFTLSSEKFTRTGYTQTGWSTVDDGEKAYELGGAYTANAAITLYPYWTVNTYNITYKDQNNADFSGVHGGGYPTTHTYGAATALVNPSKDGYRFEGWFTAPACTGSALTSLGATTYTADITLYAKWIPIYTITWKDGTTTITTTQVKHGARPAYNYQKQQTPQYTFTLTHWADESHNQYALDNLPLATEAAIYTAIYESVERSYTIRFLNDDGTTVLYSTEVTYGVKPTYEGSTPQSTLNDGWLRHFTGWSPDIVEVNGAADYAAQYEQVTLLDVPDEQSVPVTATVTTTTVRVTGRLAIEPSATLTTDDLILEGTPNSSGEITGSGTIAATQHAYYHLTKDGGFKAKTWYAVAVPWQVDVPAYDKAHNGVYAKEAGGAFVQQELGRSYDLIYYDGGLRAAEGHSDACWKYIEDDAKAEQIMYPGRAYMIYFPRDVDTIRFERKADASLKTTTLSVVEHDTSNKKNAGWNGIANPSTYHAYINPNAQDNTYGVNYGQLYDGDRWTYTPINLDAQALVVGQPVYVQVAKSNPSVVASADHDGAFHAPRRARANAMPLIQCEVGIAPSEGETTDRVIVRALEDKEDVYVIAQDLMKMGVSTIVPQMWVNRYDDRLCINTVAPTGMKADYPLGISVPYDGSYEIDVLENADANASLYLTYNGRAIWNLGYGPYEVYMQHGTNMQYGLRVVYEAPQLVTGMEEATIENGEPVRKVMIDDKVYIIRNGEMYSITGAKVQ